MAEKSTNYVPLFKDDIDRMFDRLDGIAADVSELKVDVAVVKQRLEDRDGRLASLEQHRDDGIKERLDAPKSFKRALIVAALACVGTVIASVAVSHVVVSKDRAAQEGK